MKSPQKHPPVHNRAKPVANAQKIGEGFQSESHLSFFPPITQLSARAVPSPPIQRQEADEQAPQATSKVDTLIQQAETALQEGKRGYHYVRADLESDTYFMLFRDFHVQRLHRYLLKNWLGTSGPEVENSSGSAPPPWVAAYRNKALSVLPQAQEGTSPEQHAEQKKLADLAVKLADIIAAETPAQAVRRQIVQNADAKVGALIMSQADIDEERKKEKADGYTPENFTTCILFHGQLGTDLMNDTGEKTPLVSGPNAYKEINPAAKQSLPPGVWQPCGGSKRPKPGDFLIFTFTDYVYKKDANGKDTNEVKYWKDGFAHINVFRGIQKTDPSSRAMELGSEEWITVDGGKTNAKLKTRYYNPDTCRIYELTQPSKLTEDLEDGRSLEDYTIKRNVKGWIDVGKMAEHKQYGTKK